MSVQATKGRRNAGLARLKAALGWVWPQPPEQGAVSAGVGSALIAWVWPAARDDEDRWGLAWLNWLIAWMWPSAVHDEKFGQHHWGPLGSLLAWIWPNAVDFSLQRWWQNSWLWSWMWPGRVMGPDGEICALAPWHAAVRPEVCPGEPWHHKVGRHGGSVFMMFAASAIAAPTFMETAGGDLPGGRLSLFRGGDSSQTAPPQGGSDNGGGKGRSTENGGGAGDAGAGGGGGAGVVVAAAAAAVIRRRRPGLVPTTAPATAVPAAAPRPEPILRLASIPRPAAFRPQVTIRPARPATVAARPSWIRGPAAARISRLTTASASVAARVALAAVALAVAALAVVAQAVVAVVAVARLRPPAAVHRRRPAHRLRQPTRPPCRRALSPAAARVAVGP